MSASLDAAMREERHGIWFYAACRYCTAKWFSPLPPLRCPRCGTLEPLTTVETPPWLNAQNVAEHQKTKE